MEKQKHTPEPWTCVPARDRSMVRIHSLDSRAGIANVNLATQAIGLPSARPNADRIVACVNACAGIENPAAIPAALEALEFTRDVLQVWNSSGDPRPATWAEARIEKINAALAALKGEK